ncbi:MAG: hypothetical protein ABJI96_11105 [Paracoccaceae bacterium]
MPAAPEIEYGPWNPGLSSTIPNRLMPRVTLFDPANSFVSWKEAKELSDAIGLKPQELAVTRPERLALHSVLIRVTSQLYVPDGPNYADLGISLRDMAAEIYDGSVKLEMATIVAAYEEIRRETKVVVDELLDEVYDPPEEHVEEPSGLFARLLGKKKPRAKVKLHDPVERARTLCIEWKDEHNEDVTTASRRAIARTLGGILNKRAALHVDREAIARVSVGLVMNRIGSAIVGRVVEGLFVRAVEAKGYRRLPPQSEPMVLNAKGASASGKSSIRPAQREIAERLGYDWSDFAIISPDYWRKALLDYDGLGVDDKYAAMLTGHELEVIDGKLDILMAVKGREGNVPHMLIDRFRFDSFRPGRVRSEDSTLLTRFGSKVYLFFLVTPPAATVERAWTRGVETGRFKAVDDLLYHNIEAYTGMPDLFFSWAKGRGKWVHYEFLDNSVARGERPRSIAYGQNGNLVILDFQKFCDIDRYQHVNVDAGGPDEVFKNALPSFDATKFLRRAMKEMARVDLVVPEGDAIFARSIGGRISVDIAQLPSGFDPECLGPFEEADSQIEIYDDNANVDNIGT